MHVRKIVGYQRFDTTAELRVLRELYGHLRLYKNFFQPSMKLLSKERIGGKIRRKYDAPRTPYQRLLESGQLRAGAQKELSRLYESLRVGQLRRQSSSCEINCLRWWKPSRWWRCSPAGAS